ncbi:MAG: hypothetical protein PHE55_09350 [Methylococcaceae bacterium]|nr:hypothetical protein [Methylococcaceae bacterium]
MESHCLRLLAFAILFLHSWPAVSGPEGHKAFVPDGKMGSLFKIEGSNFQVKEVLEMLG